MSVLPILPQGFVVGRILTSRGDSADADKQADTAVVVGMVDFTPATPYRKLDATTVVTHSKITAKLDSHGDLHPQRGASDNTGSDAEDGIWLPTGKWGVTYRLNTGFGALPEHHIEVTTAHTEATPLPLFANLGDPAPSGATFVQLSVPLGGQQGQVLVMNDGSLSWGTPSGGGGGIDTEAVQDIVGAMVAGAGGTYDDAAGTITLPAGGGGTVTTEQIIAAVGVVNGTNASSAQVAAWEAAGIIVLSSSPVINDTTAPMWSATLSVTDPDANAATIVATALASDDIAVTGYERKIDAGAWAAITPSGLNFDITGLTLDTEYIVQLRAHDAAGNYSDPPLSVTFTTAQANAPITDTFNRTDSAVSLGSTDTGQAWQTVYGTAGISANHARPYADATKAGVDLGVANMSVSVDYVTPAAYVGLFVRHEDESNHISADTQGNGTGFRLYKTIAGVSSVVGGVIGAIAAGSRLRLEAFDDGTATTVRRYVDDVLIATDTISDADRPQGTMGGIRLAGNSQLARWDNFELKEITA